MSKVTKSYPQFVRVLNEFLWDHLPKKIAREFRWSSIAFNVGLKCKRHRDTGNAGPSAATGLGDYTGGALMIWPDDDGKTTLDKLDFEDAGFLNSHNRVVMFDGRQAHEVQEYVGSRNSIVWYSKDDVWGGGEGYHR